MSHYAGSVADDSDAESVARQQHHPALIAAAVASRTASSRGLRHELNAILAERDEQERLLREERRRSEQQSRILRGELHSQMNINARLREELALQQQRQAAHTSSHVHETSSSFYLGMSRTLSSFAGLCAFAILF